MWIWEVVIPTWNDFIEQLTIALHSHYDYSVSENPKQAIETKTVIPYEQKYLNEIRAMPIQEPFELPENTFIIETTPNGNVLMQYNQKKNSFVYYSDNMNAIPYKHLDVAARKYAKTVRCRAIYIDMEEELLNAQKKKEQEEKKAKEMEMELKKEAPTEPRKSVFAKFKNYNRVTNVSNPSADVRMDVSTVRIRGSANTNTNTTTNSFCIKERSNHYIYAGKMSEFSFLKKPDKKLFNKKLTVSFKDFKKQQTEIK